MARIPRRAMAGGGRLTRTAATRHVRRAAAAEGELRAPRLLFGTVANVVAA